MRRGIVPNLISLYGVECPVCLMLYRNCISVTFLPSAFQSLYVMFWHSLLLSLLKFRLLSLSLQIAAGPQMMWREKLTPIPDDWCSHERLRPDLGAILYFSWSCQMKWTITKSTPKKCRWLKSTLDILIKKAIAE